MWSLIKRHLNHGWKCKLSVFETLEAFRRYDLDAVCAIIPYEAQTERQTHTHQLTCAAAAITGKT